MMLLQVISGGQTGADQAGLKAAKSAGIPTGGWLPKGCITLDGPRPDLLETYSMQEHSKSGYPPRTEDNVRDSDGTLRFAKTFKSAGERCTLKAIKWFNKPYFDIDIYKLPDREEVKDWLVKNNIKVLNIAGNSEQTAPGITMITFGYLLMLFSDLS